MTKTNKAFSFVLVILMLITFLSSCNKDIDKDVEGDTTIESNPSILPEIKEDMNIVEDGKTSFKIVRPERNVSSAVKTATGDIKKFFFEEYKVNMKASDDWVNEELGFVESEYEILIGETNREESKLVYKNLRSDDFAVTIVGTKIVIAAYSDEKILQAVEYFKEKVKISENKAMLLANDAKLQKAKYGYDSIKINGIELSNYVIVYHNGGYVTIKNAAEKLQKEISNQFGYELKLVFDSHEATEYEIVMGNTNRKDLSNIQVSDYNIFMEESKIFLNAGCGNLTADNAVDALLDKFEENSKNSTINIDHNAVNVEFKGNYITDMLLLNGKKITDYRIVYSNSSKISMSIAINLRNEIEKFCGFRIEMVNDSTTSKQNEILIGYTNRFEKTTDLNSIIPIVEGLKDGDFLTCKEGGYIFLGGKENDYLAMSSATHNFVNTIRKETPSKQISIPYGDNEIKKSKNIQYDVITYNDGDDRTTNIKQVTTILNDSAADIVGLQEVCENDVIKYKKYMKDYDIQFYATEYVGSTGYGNAIMYRKDKFDLLEHGVQWMSNTPDKKYSKYSDSAYTRSYVYAKLKDKQTGEVFVAINTHVDYNDEANSRQVAKLLELTRKKFSDYPTFYTGDFNMTPQQEGYSIMINAGLVDCERFIKNKPTAGMIDFVFVDPSGFLPTEYKYINDHEYSATASDHKPVKVKLNLIS